jgi:hypothetical protein
MTKQAAVTGHTSGMGQKIYQVLDQKGYKVQGFSLSTGCDVRDYSQVGNMIEQIKTFDLFVNCAKPDFAQTQILYRLVGSRFKGTILNIGSPVAKNPPDWKELGLLEYITQKVALEYAHDQLSKKFSTKMIMWHPAHATNTEYVQKCIEEFEL